MWLWSTLPLSYLSLFLSLCLSLLSFYLSLPLSPSLRLKSGILDSTHPTLLYHFIYSVFIHTHLTSPSSHPHKTPLRPAQLSHLDLCCRLLQSLVVCGHLQEPSSASRLW